VYPKTTPENARQNFGKISRNEEVKAEIAAMRANGDKLAGSAVMTYVEKREFFAQVVRARAALLPLDSPLWQTIKYHKGGCRVPAAG
jgi:hypothetical protein